MMFLVDPSRVMVSFCPCFKSYDLTKNGGREKQSITGLPEPTATNRPGVRTPEWMEKAALRHPLARNEMFHTVVSKK